MPSLVPDSAAAENSGAKGWQRPLGWLRRAGQFFFALSFSSLTRRIVSLNLAGLIALVASILYLSQFRAGLIDARAQSLLVQAEIIAGAIAASATVETNTITIDPDRLLDLKPGETYGAPDEYAGLDFPINPERVAPVLLYMVSGLSGKQTGKTLLAGGGYVSEIRMEIGPGFVPGEEYNVQHLVAAIEAGKVMLPERDLNFVNAYGPAAAGQR